MDTKDKIVETSRKLFNELGIKNVTARVICDKLKISPGSFSYHFPDKSVIIETLYKEMQNEFVEVLTNLRINKASILFYLETHRQIFLIQEKYKFFYLNMFEILTNYKNIKKYHLENAEKERLMAKEMILFYTQHGILKKNIDSKNVERLINVGQILNNFWAVDSEISPKKESKNKLRHYMQICCGLMEPYLEDSSLKEYNKYFENL